MNFTKLDSFDERFDLTFHEKIVVTVTATFILISGIIVHLGIYRLLNRLKKRHINNFLYMLMVSESSVKIKRS